MNNFSIILIPIFHLPFSSSPLPLSFFSQKLNYTHIHTHTHTHTHIHTHTHTYIHTHTHTHTHSRLENKGPLSPKPPCCFCPTINLSRDFLLRCNRFILQYVWITPMLAISGFTLGLLGIFFLFLFLFFFLFYFIFFIFFIFFLYLFNVIVVAI